MSTRYQIKRARLAFGHGLFNKSKPPRSEATAKEKFSCTLLMTRNDPQIAEIKQIIKHEAVARWGAKADAVLKAAEAQQKVFLRDGDLKSDYEGFADHWALACSAYTKPTTLDADKNPVDQESGVIYSGCYVSAIITIKSYDNVSKGISCEINGVRFKDDGDAFSGGRPAGEDEFEDEITDTGAVDPLLA